ncbi:hypothetical protein K443DRAFT_615856 [Laccaria amethystina LaAM-08-1]|uniref:Uncharacterized protein n=1 Tax=Laccaria amethystina LaAM-08-1 TaxID=1095629 RepID=A0A0C9X579_9AGAR|nr:hypothetical protein K443DRAFT_615856 [Laccaria amethystina LaAM-08-1]
MAGANLLSHPPRSIQPFWNTLSLGEYTGSDIHLHQISVALVAKHAQRRLQERHCHLMRYITKRDIAVFSRLRGRTQLRYGSSNRLEPDWAFVPLLILVLTD